MRSAFGHLLDGAASDGDPMVHAFREALRGVGRTSPNPPVGAVVVKDGALIGAGHHAKAGERHGEIVALDAVTEKYGAGTAKGAALYVTLEPCVHHGRTPPCVDRILAEGIARVVVGAVDPNPKVHTRGIAKLQDAGVAVELASGAVADACAALIAPFTRSVVDGRVYTVLKIAASLDGRVAARTGASRWITGEAARAVVHRLRDACDAVVVGSGTVLADDPALTVRGVEGRDPLRVIVDGRGRVPSTAKAARDALIVRAEPGARVDLAQLLRDLAKRGLTSALIEAGPGLATAFLQAGLVDELWWMTAPLAIGADGVPAIAALSLDAPADGPRFDVLHRVALGEDGLVVMQPRRSGTGTGA